MNKKLWEPSNIIKKNSNLFKFEKFLSKKFHKNFYMNYQKTPISYNPWIYIWLLTLTAMVLGIIIIGGLTRLTESGLSMTDWRPILGMIPPLTKEDSKSSRMLGISTNLIACFISATPRLTGIVSGLFFTSNSLSSPALIGKHPSPGSVLVG